MNEMTEIEWIFHKERIKEFILDDSDQEYNAKEEQRKGEFAVSDVIRDVFFVTNMRQITEERNDDLNFDNQYDQIIRIDQLESEFTDSIKILLIELRNQEYNLHNDNDEKITNNLLLELKGFVEELRYKRNNFYGDLWHQVFEERFQVLFHDDNIIDIFNKMRDRIQKQGRININSYIDQIVDRVHPKAKQRRRLLRTAHIMESYQPHPYSDIPLISQIIIDDEEYQRYLQEIHNNITRLIPWIVQSAWLVDDDSIEFRQAVEKMREYIDRAPSEFTTYRKTNGGCYALLELNSQEYHSFSNLYDTDDRNIIDYFKLAGQKRDQLFRCFEQIDNELASTWLKTIEETKRYLYPSNISEALKDAMTLYPSPGNVNGVRSDYNCCERKMFANLIKSETTIHGEVRLFARFAPCNKCKPGIFAFLDNYHKTEKDLNIYRLAYGTYGLYDNSKLHGDDEERESRS